MNTTILVILIVTMFIVEIYLYLIYEKELNENFTLRSKLENFKNLAELRKAEREEILNMHKNKLKEIVFKFYQSDSIDEFYKNTISELESYVDEYERNI